MRVANIDQTPAIVESYKNAFATGWGRTDPYSKYYQHIRYEIHKEYCII